MLAKTPLSLSLNRIKKKPLHVAIANVDDSHQFVPPCSDKELQHLAEGLKPAKTEASTQMGYIKFYEVGSKSKIGVPDDPVPDDILECHDPTTVSKYLCMFAAKTRKESDDKYSPATIKSLLSGINRTLQENKVPF